MQKTYKIQPTVTKNSAQSDTRKTRDKKSANDVISKTEIDYYRRWLVPVHRKLMLNEIDDEPISDKSRKTIMKTEAKFKKERNKFDKLTNPIIRKFVINYDRFKLNLRIMC